MLQIVDMTTNSQREMRRTVMPSYLAMVAFKISDSFQLYFQTLRTHMSQFSELARPLQTSVHEPDFTIFGGPADDCTNKP